MVYRAEREEEQAKDRRIAELEMDLVSARATIKTLSESLDAHGEALRWRDAKTEPPAEEGVYLVLIDASRDPAHIEGDPPIRWAVWQWKPRLQWHIMSLDLNNLSVLKWLPIPPLPGETHE